MADPAAPTIQSAELTSRIGRIAARSAIALLLIVEVALILLRGFRAAGSASGLTPVSVALALLGLLGVASLVLAKRRPLFVLAFVLVITLIMRDARGLAGSNVYPLPLFYALGYYALGHNWKQVAKVAAGVIGVVYLASLLRGDGLGNYGLNSLFSLLGAMTFVIPIASVGLWLGTNRAYVKELTERSARLEHERELLAERAVADERVRIARDLHDVVAHHVSLIVVQAGAIRESLPKDSGLRESLDVLADTGREAMSEMRRMLGVLRSEELNDNDHRSPAPRLAEIPALVSRAKEAGVAVDYHVTGEPRSLSEAEELCLYRVVQEALTNVVKHTEGASGSVELAYLPGSVVLKIQDRGPRKQAVGGPGHGLAGMRERLGIFGGTLDAFATGSDGFRVEARLPLGGVHP